MSTPNRRILIVGGSGAFGRRLARGLAQTGFDIVIAGRNAKNAADVAAALRREWPDAVVDSVMLDRNRVTADDLRTFGVFVVADAAGPFQGGDYRLPLAAIAAGSHYVDLADARDFVAGFPALAAAAERARVTAVAGASSTPALSHAVLDELARGWAAVDTVEIGISPGNRAPRGLSVVSAILSYAGRPVRLFLDGEWQTRPGWGLLTRKPIPGLGRRWLSLCETPDLDVVPARFGVRRTAIFRAGLELSILHLGLAAAALLVRIRLIPSMRPFARIFRAVANLLSGLGSDRGGMIVEASGRDARGAPVSGRWILLAEGGDGPVVPTLPALAVIRKLADGGLPAGAFPCVGLLTLQEIEAEFAPYRISSGFEPEACCGESLFAHALGDGFHRMPTAIRTAHMPGHRLVLSGEASIDGAENALGRVAAALLGLPVPGERVPVTVTMTALDGGEAWTRDFAGRRFRTELRSRPGGLTERFGLLAFDLDVPTSAEGLTMAITGWRLGPVPLPRTLAPRTEAREHVDQQGRFCFDVMIGLPVAGRLVRYRGWLTPQ
jgi:NAD(P)-dependent dehydrogenase (short-subunit alcohol dehydrogenase family)